MDISFLGAGSVKLSGKNLDVIVDPVPGLKAEPEVVLVTSTEAKFDGKAGMVIDGPGEYEVKGASITGVPARLHIDENGNRATIYRVEIDDTVVAVIGNITPGLSGDQQEVLGEVDVLVVPVGGHGLTLDATAAAELIGQLEPKYVVPVHYDDGSKYPMPQDKVEVFLKEVGANSEPVTKLKINPKEMPSETTVVVLSKS